MECDIYSKKSLIKNILKKIIKIIYQIIIILCFVLILIIVFQKVTNNDKSIAGYRIFRVITGSMIPQYDIGEVVISKEIDPNDIKVGDDIVYLGAYGDYKGKIVMHKVVEIEKDANNNLIFHAQGLHSGSIEDPTIKSNQIFGVVKLKSKLLTVLYNLSTNIYTAFIIIFILVLNVFISFKFSGKEVHQLSDGNIQEEENNESNTENELDDIQEIDDEDKSTEDELDDIQDIDEDDKPDENE